MLKQNYDFTNLFGLHVIIKSSATGEILISKIVKQSDFQITESKELIDGSFWLEETILKIPKCNDILLCQVTEVTYSEITNDGVIMIFPFDFIVTIDEKPIPDYIQTNINFDENHFLNVGIKVDETYNLSAEQAILDYFGVGFADIQISHVINYGNSINGYTSIRVSNENNKFESINVGLNLLQYLSNPDVLVNIFVSTEISVDNKVIKRQAQLNVDISQINPFLQNLITHPETNYPVQVVQQNIVNQTVIEAKESTKIVPIYQPVFAELINVDIIFEKKNIHFDGVTKPTYLFLGVGDTEQYIKSDQTSDGKFLFDLSKFVPIQAPTTYTLLDVNSLSKIGEGNVLLKR